MKWVELRRHSLVDKEKNVPPAGLELAQWVRGQLNLNYEACYCSPLVRCRQTIEAFGFHEYKVDEAFKVLSGDRLKPLMPQVNEIVRAEGLSFLEAFFKVPQAMDIIKERADQCLEGIRRVAGELSDSGSALIVSHGGTIEPAALLAKGTWDLKDIGGPLNECEGVVFKFDGEEIVDIYTARIRRWKGGESV